ncbi:hypothetical protein MKK65_19460, partial [Methylobacterium sp. J-001]|uniref:transketolase-like TK C-terminal-containing protein n=1 Tax=Methylobacterium sp. J-001 TaxID=2836609 RepID=UPI001FB89A4F
RPARMPRVPLEHVRMLTWERSPVTEGTVIWMNTFGASAPVKALQPNFGFTPHMVLEAARSQLATHKR